MSKPFPATIVMSNPYVSCSSCGGSGMAQDLNGVVDCGECLGNCVVRDRDEKGRFRTHPYTMYHIGDGVYAAHPTPPEAVNNQETD